MDELEGNTLRQVVEKLPPSVEISEGPLPAMAGQWRGENVTHSLGASSREAFPAGYKHRFSSKLIAGGRFLEMDFRDVADGVPISFKVLLGYDEVSKKFIEFGVTSFGEVFQSTGDYDRARRTISLSGTVTNPNTGKPETVISEYEVGGSTAFEYRLYVVDDKGNRTLVKRSHYTRM